ncbi:MAG: DNA polymerase III subunit alpha [Bacteroidetes bacterium]|nr:MAG: DNA polymerase III subunit alpha [Bacteroidota bacterium]
MYLNCKTYFSFRYGTFTTEDLVKAGVEIGANTLALTNINSTCDVWDFVQHCRDHGIKPIVGAEIRNGHQLLYILLAANNSGLSWINEFISTYLQSKEEFPRETIFFNQPSDGFVIYPLGTKSHEKLSSNELIGVLPSEINKLFGINFTSVRGKFVIRQPVSFQNKIYYNVHRLLRSVDDNVLLSKLEPASVAHPDEYFIPPGRILEIFKQYSFIVTNTYKVMEACSVIMEFGTDKNKKVFSATPYDDRELLKKLSYDGLKFRYGLKNKIAKERVEKELGIIDQLGFNSYFLITWDLIRYAQSRGYYYVGRGSGANSIVAYCLQITDVDPIELDLYFERFLNPYRTSPPDFDIDFSWKDRDDVIDYVFKRYGKKYVALLGMYSTFQYNAIVRELGKVFGLPKSEIDQLAEKGYYNGESRGENFQNRKQEDHIHQIILRYGKLIQNFPSHQSIHPGGMLISEEPIHSYAALDLPPKGFPTAQLDMFVAENIGLYKFDILSQRGLGHIRESLRLIKENKQIDVNIHEIEKFKKDDRIRNQIKTVNTIGCFYIESPAMRHLLKKLECDDYLTLVAASSIIRPGVGRSGMMHQYIYRYHNPDKFEYLHPKLEELLKQTYGVMVYQEDVIKVAHYFAGLDMGEADILRRAMSGKYRSNNKFILIRDKFFANCKAFGYAEDITKELWRQIESFGAYSFSKAHSASFAVESYQSLFLKTYFPMEFMVAVINNFGGFYSRELYFYELMKTGAKIQPPCVNQSDYLTNIHGSEVHVGLIHIKGLETTLSEKLLEERKISGAYLHLQDFIERTSITLEQLNILIRIGAFRFTGKNKKELLWEANFLQKKNKNHIPQYHSMFKDPPKKFSLPELPVYALDDWYDEVELLGFPVRDPFQLVDDDPSKYVSSKEMKNYVGKTITVLGYHITQKPVRTVKGETMSFGTFIDINKDWIDTVHFPQVYHMAPPQSGFYRITGKVMEEFGVHSIEVTYIEKAGIKKRMQELL